MGYEIVPRKPTDAYKKLEVTWREHGNILILF